MKKIALFSFFIVAFTVSGFVNANDNPSIKITSPKSFNTETGEIEIEWSSKNLPPERQLSFIIEHDLFSINTIQTNNDGKETLPLPFPGRYNIQIVNNGVRRDPIVYRSFSVFVRMPNNPVSCGDTWRPSVDLITPNGGESFTEGQSVEIVWSTCNLLPSTFMAVDLIGYNTNGTTFTKYLAMVPNTGTATVSLPTFDEMPNKIKEGDTFRIKIRDISNGEKTRDFSDSTFTLLEE